MKALAAIAIVTATVAASALSHNAHAVAQMFKCLEGGRTVYQQQACAAGTEPESAASAAAHAASRAQSGAASSAGAGRHVRMPLPASSGPATPR